LEGSRIRKNSGALSEEPGESGDLDDVEVSGLLMAEMNLVQGLKLVPGFVHLLVVALLVLVAQINCNCWSGSIYSKGSPINHS